jgi:hypothetical protein
LAELISELRSINGEFTEDSYRKRCGQLFSKSVRDTRAAALTEAAKEVMRGLGGGIRKPSATIKGCKIAICPVRAKLLVWIDVEICQHKLENGRTKGKCVSEGTFTGDQEYSVERQAIEITQRNFDDVDQPMEPNHDQHDGVSKETSSTNKTGSYLSSKQTVRDGSSSGNSTGGSAQTVENKTSVSNLG